VTTELRYLAASVILGLLHLIIDSHLISFQRGYRWTASSREDTVPPLHGHANRVDQATTNFLESFPFFAALVLAAHFTQTHGQLTLWGSASLFLGTSWICLSRGCRIRFGPLDVFLEYRSQRHGPSSDRAALLEAPNE
jgi:uncharacterized MAPEG superfamily protein